jgi:glyoxylase-like metal-dependent hydrolase (beta-lactamase superfamily II)
LIGAARARAAMIGAGRWPGEETMKRIVALLALAASLALATGAATAQSGVEKLYILNCGEGLAGDIGRWSPGVNEGKSMPFVDTCYLIKHARGWFLWDTGVSDAVAAMPDGQKPADPRMTHWRKPVTLAAEIERVGIKPSDVTFMAVSHTHPDHIGNVELFPQAMLFVQKAEYEWPGANNTPRFKPEHPVTKLEGDRDVFGDGSITIISTPGHTPGHQSLLVKLPKTGALVLSGDAVHFRSNWENRGVPSGNFNKEQTLASMQKIADLLAREHAQLWINHDKAQRDGLKMAPAFYE